ncbi:DinB family protein [Virgibacillus senegalensis]|uniref:DinB family protein n=1 Tax=Virgibacillus senegalensis TaxID=1499679 RepID=UPI001F460DAA|nr:DinB family protein [Virgibacillus senegalensis]
MLKQQYELVRYTRENLFSFCEQLAAEDYTREVDGFGWASIRTLHAHVADCYQSWLAHFGLKKKREKLNPEKISDVADMRKQFLKMDQLVLEFLNYYQADYLQKISGTVPWQEEQEQLSALWLFTHTVTHEFHHKGQIVSMARQFGYIPVDTDLLTPSDMEKYV